MLANEYFSYTEESMTSVSEISSISVANFDALYSGSKVLSSICQSSHSVLNTKVFSFPCRGFDKPTYVSLNEKQQKKPLYLCNAKDDLV